MHGLVNTGPALHSRNGVFHTGAQAVRPQNDPGVMLLLFSPAVTTRLMPFPAQSLKPTLEKKQMRDIK